MCLSYGHLEFEVSSCKVRCISCSAHCSLEAVTLRLPPSDRVVGERAWIIRTAVVGWRALFGNIRTVAGMPVVLESAGMMRKKDSDEGNDDRGHRGRHGAAIWLLELNFVRPEVSTEIVLRLQKRVVTCPYLASFYRERNIVKRSGNTKRYYWQMRVISVFVPKLQGLWYVFIRASKQTKTPSVHDWIDWEVQHRNYHWIPYFFFW